ncbi:MAG TPA: MarR family transcriptional regulator [Solirubrobacteraceae bacterium]|jgi:DNA-binding MarR family transcriptional regulator|nr:MarR family transcriptional regulator [Solirubrobacteraceae bacterium]
MTAVSASGAARAAALDQLGRSFKTAMAAVRRLRGRETHRPGELSYAQYALLFSLADGAKELSVRDLACAADLSPPSVTQMLDHLAAMGLVARARSELDKRVVLTSLTERGRSLIAERRGMFEPRWRAALADFDDEELAIAAAVLMRLGAMFDEFADDGTDVARVKHHIGA